MSHCRRGQQPQNRPQPPKPCTNCGIPAKPLSLGRCSRCRDYKRWHGTERPREHVFAGTTRAETDAEYFDRHVDKESAAPCWIWRGGISGPKRSRYGALRVRDKTGKWSTMRAHRYAWQQENGPIPAGLMVLHTCDMPLCVWGGHLFLGTALDNARDRDAKGRGRFWFRERGKV